MIWEISDDTPVIEGLDEQGRPDPAYARALGLLPAPFGRRALAALCEGLIAAVILLPALLVVVPAVVAVVREGGDAAALLARDDLVRIIVAYAVSSVLMLVYILLQLILHGRRGVTVGKAMFGIRSVNVRTLERPRFWRGAVVRYLVAYASLLVPVIGPVLVIALSPFFDPERRGRGWLDMAAGTWFVDIRRGLNPYDRKRMRVARKMQKASLHGERAPLPSLATPAGQGAPASYVPSARTSGGVLGVPRAADPASPASAAPASPAPPAATAATASAALAAASEGMIDSVPPVLGAPPASSVPQVSAHPVIVLDTGARVEVQGLTLLGRAPAANAGEEGAKLVPIEDDTRSVSKTHVALAPGPQGLAIDDRRSTNGTAIVREGAEYAVTAGAPLVLRAGDLVRFGDRTFGVEQA